MVISPQKNAYTALEYTKTSPIVLDMRHLRTKFGNFFRWTSYKCFMNIFYHFIFNRRSSCFFFVICTFFYIHKKKSIGFGKIFDFRFSMDLHVLRCPEHDLTIFRKCLSVCLSVCLPVLFCGHCMSRTNERKLMKLNKTKRY